MKKMYIILLSVMILALVGCGSEQSIEPTEVAVVENEVKEEVSSDNQKEVELMEASNEDSTESEITTEFQQSVATEQTTETEETTECIKFFSISTTKEKTFFALTIGMILINFVGWTFYYLGYQYGWLIVISQFAVVPLYYLFFGLWKSNYLLVGTASLFFIIHTINGYMNFIIKK